MGNHYRLAALMLCAWVLWSGKSGAWFPITAFESRAECEATRTAKAPTGTTEGFYVTCLPDTVDPRGPKR